MGTHDELRLRQRLSRVEALHDGATTEGERVAARRALDRLRARVVQLRHSDPVAQFCALHMASLLRPVQAEQEDAQLPPAAVVADVLKRWQRGAWTGDEVHAWAAWLCDRLTLPERVDDDGALVAEVLLQLAAWHQLDLLPDDVPGMLAFLEDGDWAAWFSLIAAAASRARSRRRRSA